MSIKAILIAALLAALMSCEGQVHSQSENRMSVYEGIIAEETTGLTEREEVLLQQVSDTPLSLTRYQIAELAPLMEQEHRAVEKIIEAAGLSENAATKTPIGEPFQPDATPLFIAAKLIAVRVQVHISEGRLDDATNEALAVWLAARSFETADGCRLVHVYIGVHTRMLANRLLISVIEEHMLSEALRNHVADFLSNRVAEDRNYCGCLMNELEFRDWVDLSHVNSVRTALQSIPANPGWEDVQSVAQRLESTPGLTSFGRRFSDLALKERYASAQEAMLIQALTFRGGAETVPIADPFSGGLLNIDVRADHLRITSVGPNGIMDSSEGDDLSIVVPITKGMH